MKSKLLGDTVEYDELAVDVNHDGNKGNALDFTALKKLIFSLF